MCILLYCLLQNYFLELCPIFIFYIRCVSKMRGNGIIKNIIWLKIKTKQG